MADEHVCHSRKVGDDGSAVYWLQGRFDAWGLWRDKVESCNKDPELSLFSEAISAIATALSRDHHLFE